MNRETYDKAFTACLFSYWVFAIIIFITNNEKYLYGALPCFIGVLLFGYMENKAKKGKS